MLFEMKEFGLSLETVWSLGILSACVAVFYK